MSGADDRKDKDNVVHVAFGAVKKSVIPEDPIAAEKLEHFTRLIDAGMVLVSLDTRKPGVSIPEGFRGDPQLGLNFSHRFGISDFDYDEQGVRATLSFQGNGHYCDIPWGAVFMLRSYVTDEVALFPDTVPPELASMIDRLEADAERVEVDPEARSSAATRDGQDEETSAPEPVTVGAEAASRFVEGSDEDDDRHDGVDDAGTEGGSDSAPRRPGLRLVKS